MSAKIHIPNDRYGVRDPDAAETLAALCKRIRQIPEAIAKAMEPKL